MSDDECSECSPSAPPLRTLPKEPVRVLTFSAQKRAQAGGLKQDEESGKFPAATNGWGWKGTSDFAFGQMVVDYAPLPKPTPELRSVFSPLPEIDRSKRFFCQCGYKTKIKTMQPYTPFDLAPNPRFGDHARFMACNQWRVEYKDGRKGPGSSPSSPFLSEANVSAGTYGWRSTDPARVVVDFTSKNKKDLACSDKVMIDAVVWKKDAEGNIMTEYCQVAKKRRPLAAGFAGTGLSPQYQRWLAHAKKCEDAVDTGRKVLEELAATRGAKKRPASPTSPPAKKAKKENRRFIDLTQDSDSDDDFE